MKTEETRIRVMIVDDHLLLRRGLETVFSLAPDIHLVGEASSGDQAIRMCDELVPDVVLMDIALPDLDGVAVTNFIKKRHANVQVIMLTGIQDDLNVKRALEAGAIGYFHKDVSTDVLFRAIRSAVTGRAMLSQEATDALVRLVAQPPTPGYDLTPRELEVLALLVSGSRNEVISDILCITPATVKNHVSKILSKLHVESRTGAVMVAIRNKLVQT